MLAEIRELEAKKDYDNPRYMELLIPSYYALHILRMPPDQWPDPVNRAFARLNKEVYIPMQGPSEMSASGKLEKWDRSADLGKIAIPTLTIGGRYDTMDPKHMERMAGLLGKGRYLYCGNGSHMAMYDDQRTYFDGLIQFIKDVDQRRLQRSLPVRSLRKTGLSAAAPALWQRALSGVLREEAAVRAGRRPMRRGPRR